MSPATTKSRQIAKASGNKNVKSNKEQKTRVPLEKRIGVRNTGADKKPGERSVKSYEKMGVRVV